MILGIDTSTNYLSLAIKKEDGQLVDYHQLQSKRHGETLLPQLEQLMKSAQLTCESIKGVAVGLGPGSFTGVRIGLATAVGMAQACACPIVGLSSYAVIAANQSLPEVVVIGDARRGNIYCAAYSCQSDGLKPFIEETLTDLDTLITWLPAGPVYLSGPDGAAFYEQLKEKKSNIILADKSNVYPNACALITLAEPILTKGGMAMDTLKPFYLRVTQAEEMAAAQLK